MISSPTLDNRILIQQAQTGQGLAGINNGAAGSGHGLDKFSSQGRHPGEVLQKIEQGPLRRKQAGGLPPHLGNNRSNRNLTPLLPEQTHLGRFIRLRQNHSNYWQSCQHNIGLGRNFSTRRLVGRNRRSCGRIAPTNVLFQRETNQPVHSRMVKRIHGLGMYTAGEAETR